MRCPVLKIAAYPDHEQSGLRRILEKAMNEDDGLVTAMISLEKKEVVDMQEPSQCANEPLRIGHASISEYSNGRLRMMAE
ncbi:MAG TPA: hypothetical protein VEY51_04575 [Chondromyces sp.]|nr:hypothetical protein [Chondromyces sp.]